jgi:lipopolysaccharide biosynthesis glycosyltransferase
MKKNIVFIPAIDAGRGRHHAYKYSLWSWQKWADKNNAEVVVWDTPLYTWEEMTIPWQRYYLFKILEHNGIEYDQILMVDSDTIVHSDTPNFFEFTERKYVGVLDLGCWEWTGRSLRHYKELFDGYKLDRGLYFNGGFQIVNETHKEFFDKVLEFYNNNKQILVEKQKSGLGTDQTPINYLVQMNNIDLKLFPSTYNLHHMVSKNLLNFGQSWWGDGLENLYEQAWVYHFNAIPKNGLNRDSGYFLKRAYEELWEK